MQSVSVSFFQTPEWEEFKKSTGYQQSYRIGDILVLQKDLPLRRSMLYSPMVNEAQGSRFKAGGSLKEISKIAKNSRAVFYRLELDVPLEEAESSGHQPSAISALRKQGFQRAFEEMQPEHTLIVNLAPIEDEILAQMKSKGRYNIKVAERSGVTVKSSTEQKDMDAFYDLYATMAKRQKISHRSKRYFDALLEIMREKGYLQIYTASARAEGNTVVLAGAIVIFFEQTAIYLYGGSSDLHRNLMAPYFLHWQAIRDAKARGCTSYDMFGIAPNDDPHHAWAGITRFKKQFGGREVALAGSWDLVFRPAEYQVFKIAERIRR